MSCCQAGTPAVLEEPGPIQSVCHNSQPQQNKNGKKKEENGSLKKKRVGETRAELL